MRKTATTLGTGARAATEFESIFVRLRELLRKHSSALVVTADSPAHYGLGGSAGPAALQAWGGKAKRPTLPIAWVQIGKAYVSYHLMGVYQNPTLQESMSKALKARMQGKSCFNFKAIDEALFKELDRLTAQSIASFKKAGYISEGTPKGLRGVIEESGEVPDATRSIAGVRNGRRRGLQTDGHPE